MVCIYGNIVKRAGVDKADGFYVDYIKVYQNENDLSAVQPDSDFTGSLDLDEKRYAKSALQQRGAFYCV